MDRLTNGDGDAIIQFFAQQSRDTVIANISGEEEFDPLDKTDRADICPGTALKLWDDVSIYSGFVFARVICGAGGRGCFTTYRFDPANGGHIVEIYEPSAVTDRAPYDPQETPMPVIPEPGP